MRPNIDISHTLNGQVKDYAEQQDVSLEDAYQEIIEAGLQAIHPDGPSEYEVKILRMEDIIKDRIGGDKEHCQGTSNDWEDYYDGKCFSCGRVWEEDFLMPSPEREQSFTGYGDTMTDTPDDLCIPCWREAMDYPKIPNTVREAA